jgi:uncharacterized protein (TIGR01619 family)
MADFMSLQWEFYPCLIEEKHASVFVDIGINKELPLAGIDKLLNIRLTLKTPSTKGLSTNGEFEGLCQLEDTIEELLEGREIYYVGRITSNGYREYFYYSKNFNYKKELMQTIYSAGYEFDYVEADDPNWASFKEDLFPTNLDWQVISDRKVMDSLEKKGDNGEEERIIDHSASFPKKENALAFCEKIKTEGFKSSCDVEFDKDGNATVSFNRNESPIYPFFSNTTMSLLTLAKTYNGNYNGWACSVVK